MWCATWPRTCAWIRGQRSSAVEAYLAATPPLPEWADPELMAQGATFFATHALEIGSALFCGSLPEGYASPRGARVLTLTGRLVAGPVRRVTETAQMVLDAMTTDGLEPGVGAGWEDLRRVRLMHAAVRHFINDDPSVKHTPHLPAPAHGWCDGWGTPLNQEDLLGGLLTFTVTVFEVLDKLAVDYDEADVEAYLHRWCVIGSLLGIRHDILPLDRDHAALAATLIRIRQEDASRDGRRLTQALIGAIQASMPSPALRGLVPAAVRWFLGPDVANLLGIERNAWTYVLDGPVRRASQVVHVDERHDELVQRCMRYVGGSALRGFMDANRGEERPSFAIPIELEAGAPTRTPAVPCLTRRRRR